MKNEMQLKALIKNIAKEKNIQAQAVMQNYMFERLLERISLSDFKDRFILKGGMLIAAMVGLEHRSTMDMDATIRNYPVNENDIRAAFENIAQIDIGDDVSFEITGVEPIRRRYGIRRPAGISGGAVYEYEDLVEDRRYYRRCDHSRRCPLYDEDNV